MPKNRVFLVVATVLVAVSIPLWAYSAYLAAKGDLDLDWSIPIVLAGVGLIFLPNVLPKDHRVEIWQLLTLRFVTMGFGVTLLAFGFDTPPAFALVGGIIVGTLWVAWWFVGRPGEIKEQ